MLLINRCLHKGTRLRIPKTKIEPEKAIVAVTCCRGDRIVVGKTTWVSVDKEAPSLRANTLWYSLALIPLLEKRPQAASSAAQKAMASSIAVLAVDTLSASVSFVGRSERLTSLLVLFRTPPKASLVFPVTEVRMLISAGDLLKVLLLTCTSAASPDILPRETTISSLFGRMSPTANKKVRSCVIGSAGKVLLVFHLSANCRESVKC